jgi:hypothetical protein
LDPSLIVVSRGGTYVLLPIKVVLLECTEGLDCPTLSGDATRTPISMYRINEMEVSPAVLISDIRCIIP